jgi:hypothetical protein
MENVSTPPCTQHTCTLCSTPLSHCLHHIQYKLKINVLVLVPARKGEKGARKSLHYHQNHIKPPRNLCQQPYEDPMIQLILLGWEGEKNRLVLAHKVQGGDRVIPLIGADSSHNLKACPLYLLSVVRAHMCPCVRVVVMDTSATAVGQISAENKASTSLLQNACRFTCRVYTSVGLKIAVVQHTIELPMCTSVLLIYSLMMSMSSPVESPPPQFLALSSSSFPQTTHTTAGHFSYPPPSG